MSDENNPCSLEYCQNDGACYLNGRKKMQCFCREGFEGTNCEINKTDRFENNPLIVDEVTTEATTVTSTTSTTTTTASTITTSNSSTTTITLPTLKNSKFKVQNLYVYFNSIDQLFFLTKSTSMKW